MINKKGYDYDQVHVLIDSKYVSYEQEVAEPDLTCQIGSLTGKLPIILYYEADEGSAAMEKACEEHGIITAGALGTKISLPLNPIEKTVYGDAVGYKLFEAFAPLSAANVQAMKDMKAEGNSLVVGCSASTEHARAVANELRLATAVLIGPTQTQTTKRLESVGMTVPRVTMLEDLSANIDVPVIVTASSPSDVCKALIAGADAVLIHFGTLEDGDQLDFAVKAVADSLRETLTELCQACGAKDIKSLATRCKLTPC